MAAMTLARLGGTSASEFSYTTSTCDTSTYYGQAQRVVYVREDPPEPKPTRIKCEYCAQINGAEMWHCHQCGGPLPF